MSLKCHNINAYALVNSVFQNSLGVTQAERKRNCLCRKHRVKLNERDLVQMTTTYDNSISWFPVWQCLFFLMTQKLNMAS